MPSKNNRQNHPAHPLRTGDIGLEDEGPASSVPQMPVGRQPITYGGERVLTTDMTAESFEVDIGRITNNFERNRARFEEGKHFYKVEGAELRAIKNSPSIRGSVGVHARSLILWTQRGIARHAKMLETDTAWAIFESLEDNYFRVTDCNATRAPSIPDFTSPAAAARAWAEQYEGRLLAEKTKAQIGTRREATAMSTASTAVRLARKLEADLDRSREYATLKRMSMIHHGQKFDWRKLKAASAEMEIPTIDVFDQNYGTVKAYHADVWREAYALEIPAPTDAGDA